MRLITAAGLLVLSTGPALGAYLVDLDAGDRMTVDSYWEDGDRVHLLRGGVDLIVPRRRIRSLKETSGAEVSANGSAPASTPPRARPADAQSKASPEDLQAEQRRISHHLLRVQQERFEARNRNDPPAKLKRLEKEFQRTQKRRLSVLRDLAER